MPLATSVKIYKAEDGGAPVLNGVAGALQSLLYTCLVTGYNVKSPTSVTRDGAEVTVAYAAAHGHKVNQALRLSGANETDYNGDFRIIWTDTLSLKFALDAGVTPTTPASGAIETRVAPAGWERTFSGTNKAVFRSLAPQTTGYYLRLDDAAAQYAIVRGYVSMSDIDTGAELWVDCYWKKSSTSDATARSWILIVDDTMCYLCIGWNSSLGSTPQYAIHAFGDINSLVVGDGSHCIAVGYSLSSPVFASQSVLQLGGITGITVNMGGGKIARAYNQFANSVANLRCGSMAGAMDVNGASAGNSSFSPETNLPDNSLHFFPVYAFEYSSSLARNLMRGIIPGVYHMVEYLPTVDSNGINMISDVTGMQGKILMMVRSSAGGGSNIDCRVLFDITGPWR